MTAYYVRSGAVGTGTGASWANAFTTLTTAFATEVAGDTLYVSEDHAETTAGSVTLTSSGTQSNITKIVCANHAGSVPPVAADLRATATVSSTGTNNLTFEGCAHYDGIIFNSGTGSTSSANIILGTSNNDTMRFDNCSLRLGITAGSSKVFFGGASSNLTGTYFELKNTTISCAATSHVIQMLNTLKWRNTPSALLGTIPTQVLTPTVGGVLECFGVDFSAAGSGKTLIGASGSLNSFKIRLLDCKLDAAVTKSASPIGFGTTEIDFIRCGATGVNYAIFRQSFNGTLDHETTIVRTGGASDGTTTLSWKIITNGNSSYSTPFECPPLAIWNDTTGSSVTATIEGIWGGGAVPNDDEVWIDVEYLSDASSPQSTFVNDGKASLLATAAGQDASSQTWGGSTTKFKLVTSFTAQQKGWIYARVRCAKASTTFYIDPLITLS